MKKLIALVLFAILLVGCSANNNMNTTEPNKESEIKISFLNFDNEEYSIMKATGTKNNMIFQIDLGDSAVKSINYWVDHYVDGILKDPVLNIGSPVRVDEKDYKIYLSTMDVDTKNAEVWTMALRHNGNIASGQTVLDKTDYDNTLTYPFDIISMQTGQVAELGMIVRNNGNGLSSGDDVEKTIKENKEVYVIRCRMD